jgi:predicted DNA-binding transcriptional regulator AlpA
MTEQLSQFLREKQLREEFLKVSHSTLWRWVADNRFPAPVRCGPRVTAWRRCDVETWAEARVSESVK